MTHSEFTTLFEQTIDAAAGSVKPDEALADIVEWDSVSVLTFIAMADEKFDQQPSGRDIAACTTVTDLAMLFGDKISG